MSYYCLLNIRNPHNMQIKTLTTIGDTAEDAIRKTIIELQKSLENPSVYDDFGIVTTSPVTADYAMLQADTAEDEIVRIRCAMDGLSEGQANSLKFYCKGWSYKKIAQRFNIGLEAVKSLLKRACTKSGKKTLESLKNFLTGAGKKPNHH